ncbi:hypothetical protein J6590_090632, partial [Homalodisca vitripennis]
RSGCALIRGGMFGLGLLTLPWLYMYEVIIYCRSECALIRGGDVQQYDTRGRDNFR